MLGKKSEKKWISPKCTRVHERNLEPLIGIYIRKYSEISELVSTSDVDKHHMTLGKQYPLFYSTIFVITCGDTCPCWKCECEKEVNQTMIMIELQFLVLLELWLGKLPIFSSRSFLLSDIFKSKVKNIWFNIAPNIDTINIFIIYICDYLWVYFLMPPLTIIINLWWRILRWITK